MPWASTTLTSRCNAGRRNTVKLRSNPVTGSLSPKGAASSAGSHRLQPRATAVALATRAAARMILRLV